RIFTEPYIFLGDARPVRYRDGRGVGNRRVAGNGICSAEMAGNSFRNIAERLLGWVFACGCGCPVCAADVGMAAHVLAGRTARAAGILHSRARARIGSVETPPRA